MSRLTVAVTGTLLLVTACDGLRLGASDSGVSYVFVNNCDGPVQVTPATGGITDVLEVGDSTTRRGLDEFVGQSLYLISLPDGTGELALQPESADVELVGSLCPGR